MNFVQVSHSLDVRSGGRYVWAYNKAKITRTSEEDLLQGLPSLPDTNGFQMPLFSESQNLSPFIPAASSRKTVCGGETKSIKGMAYPQMDNKYPQMDN